MELETWRYCRPRNHAEHSTYGCRLLLSEAGKTIINDINNRGHIVGYYVDANGTERGFLRQGSQFVTVDIPGSVNTHVEAISDQSRIVGFYVSTSGAVINFHANVKAFTELNGFGSPDSSG